MLRTLRMSTNDLIKINAFAAPAHIEFRLTGRVIRVRNGDKSPARDQRERLDRLHRHATHGQQDQSISVDRKNDFSTSQLAILREAYHLLVMACEHYEE